MHCYTLGLYGLKILCKQPWFGHVNLPGTWCHASCNVELSLNYRVAEVTRLRVGELANPGGDLDIGCCAEEAACDKAFT